jgi:predicted kinase
MSGIPGSGKNFYIEQNFKDAYICSADDFCMIDGKHVFNKNKLGENHNKCLKKFIDGINANLPLIVVNNTNIKTFEIAPYYRTAEAFGYEVEIIRLICDVEVAIARGLHGVPPEQVRQMSLNFDPLPPWWKIKQIFQK